MESVIYYLWLSLKAGTSTSEFCELLEEYGSSEDIYNMNFDSDNILSDKDLTYAQKEYDKCCEEKVCIVSYTDEIYPQSLREIDNPPLVLYCKGNVSLLKRPLLSVAGTKNCSNDGKNYARRFAKSVYENNIVPVTPFSPGIEAEVCKSVDEVIVIMPCGIDKTYPAKQFSLKNKIIKDGGLVITEQPLGMGAIAHNIVSRNRLIAAISLYSLIIQAHKESNTGIIFDFCQRYGRGCFVIPGDITNPYYEGCNSFIKRGGILVTEPQDIINFYRLIYPDVVTEHKETEVNIVSHKIENDRTNPSEKAIIDALNISKLNYDELVEKSGLSASEAASAVTMLEMLGIIENTGGVFSVK